MFLAERPQATQDLYHEHHSHRHHSHRTSIKGFPLSLWEKRPILSNWQKRVQSPQILLSRTCTNSKPYVSNETLTLYGLAYNVLELAAGAVYFYRINAASRGTNIRSTFPSPAQLPSQWESGNMGFNIHLVDNTEKLLSHEFGNVRFNIQQHTTQVPCHRQGPQQRN
jgi:hypothetical protein